MDSEKLPILVFRGSIGKHPITKGYARMKAIIPVAGIGTRLRPHTYTAPKVLLPVAGKPILAHILDELTALGLDEVTFIIGYKGEMIRDFVNQNYKVKANFVEQPEMLGLGHAISLAKPFHNSDEPVLIILGDTIFSTDLKSVIEAGESAIGVHEVEDGRRFGIVELNDDGSVKKLIEKPENPPTNLALVGIYFMKHPTRLFDALDAMIEKGTTTKGEFQLTDALQSMLSAGETMKVFNVEGWFDCGKAETILATNKALLDNLNGHGNETELQARFPGSVIRMPAAIGEDVVMEHCIIGPYVSVSAGTTLRNCIVSNSIVGCDSMVCNIVLQDSIVSDNAKVTGNHYRLNVGDSSEISLD
jgi:glucose-1-phosphate thymidylyltransferase